MIFSLRSVLFALFLLCVGILPSAFAQTKLPLSIVRVTPQGEDVTSTRQIVFEFNRSVVAIGKMNRAQVELGITITPSVTCDWRWINTQTLACNLDEKNALQPATTYQIKMEPKIEALDGAKISETYHHSFKTERPDVSYMNFKNWKGPSQPVMRVVFNQPVSQKSVEKALALTDTVTGKNISVVASPDEGEQEMPYVLSLPHEGKWVLLSGENRKSDSQVIEIKGEQARRVWVVEPIRPSSEGAEVALMLRAGLVSALGPEQGAKEREIQRFSTYPAPQFLGVRCLDMNNEQMVVPPEGTTRKCDPMGSFALAFSSPVSRSMVKDNAVFNPPLNGNVADFNPWGEDNYDRVQTDTAYHADAPYFVWLPVGLKAAQNYMVNLPVYRNSWWDKIVQFFMGVDSQQFQDQFGRPVVVAKGLAFETDHRKPNYEMLYNDALLEDGVDSEVPLYVNNIESFRLDGQVLKTAGYDDRSTVGRKVAKVEDVQFAVPVPVRDMLDGKSGVVFGWVSTVPAIPNKYEDAGRLFAQVSPYQITFKFGHFQSVVWVTELATGQPVAEATITLFKGAFTNLNSRDVVMSIKTDANGMAVLPGSSEVDPDMSLKGAWKDGDIRLFVEAKKADKMALLPLSYKYEVNTYAVSDNVYANTEARYGHMKAWGTTAQGIYHAGDSIQYKVFVRDQNNLHFVTPPKATYSLEIIDPMDNIVDTKKIDSLSAFGTYSGEYAVPESAPVGWYHFSLKAKFDDSSVAEKTFEPLRVLVSDFTPSPFRVATTIKGEHFKAGDTMNVETLATLHSGGAYGDAPVRVTTTLEAQPFQTENPKAQGFSFDSFEEGIDSVQLSQKMANLSGKGEWSDTLTLQPQKIVYGTIEVESAVRDERGKSVAGIAKASFSGVDRLVGLKSPQWIYEKDKAMNIPVLVVDDNGVPAAGTQVSVVLERENVVTAKVKGAGNAYLSDTTVNWERESDCSFASEQDEHICSVTPKSNGTYRLTANIKDTKGVDHTTKMFVWVTGSDYVQWNDNGADYRLTMIPEKPSYKLGETAKFLIKNPFPGAKALVSIERLGVMESYVTTLEGSMPIISIPVKSDYVPGFYVSVTAVSPRVSSPPPEKGQIDMGKPSIKIGYAKVPVIDTDKMIDIVASSDKDVYRPRDTVNVTLTAKPQSPTNEPMELAVAVLDESVFDLLSGGRDTFDPYKGFYSLDDLDVRNFNLLSALIGRQKFEKKGANPGGDGGSDTGMRDQFRFVSYWNPSLATDKNGKANISFEVPDNLTGWRILAFAVTPNERMGLGEGTFKVNRPTEVRPVMPNQVHEGDKFRAGFSVMNRTDAERSLRVEMFAEGNVAKGDSLVKTITLAPYKRETVYMDVDAALLPVDRSKPDGEIKFKVSAADKEDRR